MRILPPSIGVVLALACAANGPRGEVSSSLHAYEIIVSGRDSLSRALAQAFARAGFTVRDEVRGGGKPAAALVVWRSVDPAGVRSLEGELADTRRGTVLASAVIPADTLLSDLQGRAGLLVRALLTPSP